MLIQAQEVNREHNLVPFTRADLTQSLTVCPAYIIEQNRTKIQSNPITEHESFDRVWQSNKTERLFCCEFY